MQILLDARPKAANIMNPEQAREIAQLHSQIMILKTTSE